VTRSLPRRPHLEQLKHQAHDLLHAFQQRDPQAINRVIQILPKLTDASRFSLTRAQYIIAREYGFASWPKLRQHVADILSSEQASRVLPALSAAEMQQRPTRQKHAHLKLMAEHMRQKPPVLALTEQVLTLAMQNATEELITTFARMPARLILAVRANILASGHYQILTRALIQGLDHPRARIRQNAAQALDILADNECIPALKRALTDPVPRVRRTAFHALTCDDCKIAPLQPAVDLTAIQIEQALHDGNLNIRRGAIASLGKGKRDPGVVAALQAIVSNETDSTVREDAERALEQQQQQT